jgi:hypothetical protein
MTGPILRVWIVDALTTGVVSAFEINRWKTNYGAQIKDHPQTGRARLGIKRTLAQAMLNTDKTGKFTRACTAW